MIIFGGRFQKRLQKLLKCGFYVTTPTCSISTPGYQVGGEPAEVTVLCFSIGGFQLSGINQKYTAQGSHI